MKKLELNLRTSVEFGLRVWISLVAATNELVHSIGTQGFSVFGSWMTD